MMKNMRVLIYLFVCVCPFFFSCEMKKDLFGDKDSQIEADVNNVGLLDLSIFPEKEPAMPVSKVDSEDDLKADDFAISIADSLGQTVKVYDSYAALKEEELLLPVGAYAIHAFWGEDAKAAFNAPYYVGDTVCTVLEKEVTKVELKCRLGNKKVQFSVTEQFEQTFLSDYTIVVDNGLGVLTISSDELRKAHLKNTGALRFTLYATDRQNQICTYSVDLSKDSVIQKHNNIFVKLDANKVKPEEPDQEGEEPEEPEDPEEPEEPENPENPDFTMKAPILKVDVTLVEKDYVIEIPSDFVDSEKPDVGGDDSDGGDDKPGGGDEGTAKPSIKGDGFDIASPVQITPSNAAGKKVRIKIETPGKLASLKVSISSSTGVLEPLLQELKLGTSFDMCSPTADQRKALTDLGLAIPSKGITSTVFDISSFMPLIALLDAGNYMFTIKATDEANQSASKTLTVKLSK